MLVSPQVRACSPLALRPTRSARPPPTRSAPGSSRRLGLRPRRRPQDRRSRRGVVDAAWPEISNAVSFLPRRPHVPLGRIAPSDEAPYRVIHRHERNRSLVLRRLVLLHRQGPAQAAGEPVRKPYANRYCGGGDLAAYRDRCQKAIRGAAQRLSAEQGPDPGAWRADTVRRSASRSAPGSSATPTRCAGRPAHLPSGHRVPLRGR